MKLPISAGEPTPFTQSRFKYVVALLLLHTALIVYRILVLHDIFCAFFQALTVALGWLAIREKMQVTMLSIWGLLNFYSCLTDSFSVIEGTLNSVHKMDFMRLAIVIMYPVCDLLSARLAWEVFKDHERNGGMLAPIMFLLDGDATPASKMANTADRAEKGEQTPLVIGSGGKYGTRR